jgi:hypothetical protein
MYLFKFSVHCSLFITCWSSNFSLNFRSNFSLRFFTFQIYFAVFYVPTLFCGFEALHGTQIALRSIYARGINEMIDEYIIHEQQVFLPTTQEWKDALIEGHKEKTSLYQNL